MTAEEHLKVIVGDMHAHLVTQLAMAFSERDQARAERDAVREELVRLRAEREHTLVAGKTYITSVGKAMSGAGGGET